MPDFDSMRARMIKGQILPNKVTDPRLIGALSTLPRERFVPRAQSGVAYVDEDLEIAPGRFLMEPVVFARMVQEAGITDTDTVLDIACGSGYSTAVLARLAGAVIGLETDAALRATATSLIVELGIDNALVVDGALAEGYPEQAPYDVILLGGAVNEVPDALFSQLADNGRLMAVIPERHLSDRCHVGQARRFVRVRDAIGDRPLFDAAIPPLPGFDREPRFVF